MFIPLCAILVSSGIVIPHYFPRSFSLGGWIGALTLFILPGSAALLSSIKRAVKKVELEVKLL
jgi:hypothetical protein